ncbi:MAG: DivIVA domain-containing protein, partial [Actinomycetota bacterium]|nr:DivIVA domain-containing protein [Actinomycetota bacterium]
MALNPEDVVKKSFNATHLRRGYDETQVDDFLDEVVIELRRLTAHSDDLRSQLDDCRASKGLDTSEGEDGAETPRPGATLDEQQLAQVRREREELVGELGGLQEQVDATRAEAEAAKAQLQEAAAAREAAAEAMSSSVPADDAHVAAMAAGGARASSEEPAAIISLAQRLHDEHVQEGMTTKERLVSEAEQYRDATVTEADQRSRELIESGQSQHDELVSTGQTQHDELVRTGQERHDELVRTGQERHDELVSTGQEQHDQTIREAEAQRSSVLTDL